MEKFYKLLIATFLVAILVGCSGGGKIDENEEIPSGGIAYYYDSVVDGVGYECGKFNGKTDKDGSFIFEKEEDCNLFLANITLRNVPKEQLKDNIKILETNITVAQFLQSLDNDANVTNGIVIIKEIEEFLKKQNIDTIPASEEELQKLIELLKKENIATYNGDFIPIDEAKLHLDETKKQIDKTPPVITLIGEEKIEIEYNTTFNDPGIQVVDDYYSLEEIKIITEGEVDSLKVGRYTINYIAIDGAGNEANATRFVTVVDTVPPLKPSVEGVEDIVNKDSIDITIKGESNVKVLIDDKEAGNLDINGELKTVLELSKEGENIFEIALKDSSNNISEKLVVTVTKDVTPPSITLKGDNPQTLEFGSKYEELGADVKDNIDSNPTLIIDSSKVDVSKLGEYQVTYIAKDTAGNEANVRRVVKVVDNVPPTLTLFGDKNLTVELGEGYKEPGFEAIDNADGNITSKVQVLGSVEDKVGGYTLIYKVADSSGNEANATRFVTVLDTTPPKKPTIDPIKEVVNKDSIDITIKGEPNAKVLINNKEAGNLDINGELKTVLELAKEGENIFEIALKDSSNNISEKLVVTVTKDVTPPSITLKGDNPQTLEFGSKYEELGADVKDNIDSNPTLIIDSSKVDVSKLGEYQVTYIAKDTAGNEANVTRVVKIVDTTPPVITLKGDNPQIVEFGTSYQESGADVKDNVDSNVTLTVDSSKVDINKLGEYQVTYIAKDSQGNEAKVIRVVKVVDTVPPTITLFGDKNTTLERGFTYKELGYEAIDNVDGNITDKVEVLGDIQKDKLGEYTLTYKVSDSSGNEANTTRVVTVIDTIPPEVAVIEDAPELTNLDSAEITIKGEPYTKLLINNKETGSLDKDGLAIVTLALQEGENSFEIVLEDEAQNRSEPLVIKIVRDSIPPVLTLIGDSEIRLLVGEDYNELGATAIDERDGNITSEIKITSNVNISQAGIYEVIYEVADKAGNKAEAIRKVIVNSQGTAQLGNLANANVKIYKIEDNGTKSLLWTETTSTGDSLESIGKFNIHDAEIDDNSFYLYEVTGGEDWDADDDGVKDENATLNRGKVRAIAKGSDIKAVAGELKVTAISEILYEKVALTLKYHFNKDSFQEVLINEAKTILPNKSLQDLLTFDPVTDKNDLEDLYKYKFNEIITNIQEGKYPLLNVDPILGTYDTGRYAKSVAISSDGTKAYVIGGSGLIILDVSNPINPVKLGSFDIDNPYRVTLSSDGTKAYVVDYAAGLIILDVSDSSNPTEIGSFYIDSTEVTLSNDETKAYVAGANSLVVLDISDPSNPIKLGSLDIDGAIGVTLSSDGTKAYVASYSNGLVIVDISNLSDLVKIASVSTAFYSETVEISSDGTKAYMTDNYNGLVVIDISDPLNPLNLGSFDTGEEARELDLSKDGTKAYVIDSKNGLVIMDVTVSPNLAKLGSYNIDEYPNKIALSTDGTKAYMVNYRGLLALDVSNPLNPVKLSTIDGSYYNDIVISNDGTKAYVASEYNDLIVLNISDLLNPIELSSLDIDPKAYGVILSSDETKAYVATDEGLVIIDISNPSNPTQLSSFDCGNSRKITLSSDETKAYVTTNEGLVIIDISDLSNPVKIGSIGGNYQNIVLSTDGTKAYVTDDYYYLSVIDVSDPSNPDILGDISNTYLRDLTISRDNTKAYVTTNEGLVIIDITEPSSLVKLGSFDVGYYATAVTLSSDETKAYVGSYDNLVIIDLTLFE